MATVRATWQPTPPESMADIRICNPNARCDAASCGGMPHCVECGVATALTELAPGEHVLNLDAGTDLGLIEATQHRVRPGGRVITPSLTGGSMQKLDLPDNSVDLVVANCGLNLAEDPQAALTELARVTLPGGRLSLCEIISESDSPHEGPFKERQMRAMLSQAGWVDVSFTRVHEVFDGAWSCVIRGFKI